MTGPAEEQAKHGQYEALGGEGFGGGNANFRSGVEINAPIGLLSNTAANDIADRQSSVSHTLHFSQCGERICCLTTLGNRENQRPGADGRMTISQLTGILYFNGDASEAFNQIFPK